MPVQVRIFCGYVCGYANFIANFSKQIQLDAAECDAAPGTILIVGTIL